MPGSISCSIGTGFKKSLTCTKVSTTVMRASCASTGTIDSTSYPVYVLTVNNVQNPSSALSVTGIAVQTQSSTTVLDTGTASVVYTAVTIPASRGSLSSSDPTVGTYAILTAQLTISNPIPSDGKVLIILPKWDDSTAATRTSMAGRVTSCTAGSDISGNSPTCLATLNTPSSTQDTITVTGAFTSFTSSFASGKTLSVGVSLVRNPPSVEVYSNYEIYTTDNAGNYIEKCSGLSLQLTTVGSLNTDSYVKLISNTVVNLYGTYRFYLKVGNPIPVGGWISIKLPSDVKATASTITFTTLTPAILDQSASVSLSGTTVSIKNGITSYVQEGDVFLFNLGGIKNPFSTKPTSSFEVYTFNDNNYGIDKLTSGLTVTATTGKLTNVKIAPVNITGVLQYATSYSVQFTIGNYIDSTTTLYIALPSSNFDVSSRTCTISNYTTTFTGASKYSCKSDYSSMLITITKFVTATTAAGTAFSFQIDNLYIRNPSTSKASSTFTIYTAYNSYTIDTDSSVTFSAEAVDIPQMDVTASNYSTSKDNVMYNFTIRPPGYVIKTAVINLTIPSEISISDSNTLSSNCEKERFYFTGFNPSSIKCTIRNSRSIIIQNAFAGGATKDFPTLRFQLRGLRNPRSFNETSSFQVFIYDSSTTYPLFNKTTEVTVQMNKTGNIRSASISRGSEVNGQITNYTFTISLNNTFVSGDYLMITFPTSNGPTSNTTTSRCIGLSSNLQYNLGCTFSNAGQTLRVPLKVKSTSLRVLGGGWQSGNGGKDSGQEDETKFDGQDYEYGFARGRQLQSGSSSSGTSTIWFNVTNIKNPISMRPSSTFTITQYTSEGYLVEQTVSGITIRNTQPSELKFSQVSIAPQSFVMNETTSYVFTFNPSNYLQNMIMFIVLPQELTVAMDSLSIAKNFSDNASCSPLSGLDSEMSCSYNSTNRTWIIKNAFTSLLEPRSIRFQLNNITNPINITQTSTFKVYTYSSDYYMLDKKETGLYVNFLCQLPCNGCRSDDNTECTSCFTTDDTTSQSYTGLPYLYKQACIEQCPISMWADRSKNNECKSCYTSHCLACTGSLPGYCTICSPEYTLLNGNCVQFENAIYFFPFLIATVLWILAVFVITLVHEKTWFITSCLFGVSIIELLMMIFETAQFLYFGFFLNMFIVIIGGLGLNCLINIIFMILYLAVIRKNDEVRIHVQAKKGAHVTAIVFACLFSSRLFKILYSNFLGRRDYNLDLMFSDAKTKRTYLAINYISYLPSLVLIANASYNIVLSIPLHVSFTVLVDIERFCIGVIVIILAILEFAVPKRPALIQKMIDKASGKQGPRSVNEKYNEVASSSMATFFNMDESQVMNGGYGGENFETYNKSAYTRDGPGKDGESYTKAQAIRQILQNLKKIRPDQLDSKLQDMLEEEEQKGNKDLKESETSAKGGEHKRRASDPPPYSKDNRKSIHYMHHKSKLELKTHLNDTNAELMVQGSGDEESDTFERQIMSLPLTPNREKRYRDHGGKSTSGQIAGPLTFRKERLDETLKITKKDQEIHMSVTSSLDKTQQLQQQLSKLEQEKEDLRKMNDLLREQREQLEIERAEIEKMRAEGAKSARIEKRPQHDQQLVEEGTTIKGTSTARGRDRSPNKGIGKRGKESLDEVRESQSELIDDDKRGKIRKTLAKDRSQVINSRNKLVMGQRSKQSINSEDPSISPKPHRCHGQSHSTLRSVYKLRQKKSSRNSSQVDFGSPDVKQNGKGLQSKRGGNSTRGFGSFKGSIVGLPGEANDFNDNSSISSPQKRNNSNNKAASGLNLINLKTRPEIYTKKTGTKVYYSDKSESSVEDLMDETPSNYNIPNGRLDGKSTGFRFGKKGKLNVNTTADASATTTEHLQTNKKKNNSPPLLKKFRKNSISGGDGEGFQNEHSMFNLDSNLGDDASLMGAGYAQIIEKGSKKRFNEDSLYRIQNNISNLSMDRTESVMTQPASMRVLPFDYSMGGIPLINGEDRITVMQKKQKSTNPNPPLTGERIKALEVAYLTKLAPSTKSAQKMVQNLNTASNLNNRVSITQRFVGNQTPDMGANFTGMQVLQLPQINNFNKQ